MLWSKLFNGSSDKVTPSRELLIAKAQMAASAFTHSVKEARTTFDKRLSRDELSTDTTRVLYASIIDKVIQPHLNGDH